jgi:hypothetical protein
MDRGLSAGVLLLQKRASCGESKYISAASRQQCERDETAAGPIDICIELLSYTVRSTPVAMQSAPSKIRDPTRAAPSAHDAHNTDK